VKLKLDSRSQNFFLSTDF